MELELILTELQPFKLSHFRQLCVCVINSLKFSMDHFETMHTCSGYIEDVHVNFCRGKIIFDKITAFST